MTACRPTSSSAMFWAECRVAQAIEWLGDAIPDWPQACTITVQVGSQLTAGVSQTWNY